MKRMIALFVVAIFVAALPELANAKPAKTTKGPKATTAITNAKPANTKSTKTTKTTKTTKSTKVAKTTNPKATTNTKAAKPTKASKPTKSAKASTTTTSTTTNTPTNETTTGTTERPRALPKNAKLVERLQKMLPDGTDMNEAASKFRNQGQFVAAVHASNRLDVPFEDLKAYMVDDGMSLGQAIKKLRPGVDAGQAAATATAQANTDLGTTQTKTKRR